MPEKADLRRIDAWRTRRLEFSDKPLAQAVEEFNRYSDTRVVVGTADLEAVRVSGVFQDWRHRRLPVLVGTGARRVQTLEAAGEVTLVRIQP